MTDFIYHLCVNSLSDCINCKCVMYADDTTLLFTASVPTTLQLTINDDLSKIAHWFETNQLTLNTKRNKFMIFWNNHVLDNFSEIKLNYDMLLLKELANLSTWSF